MKKVHLSPHRRFLFALTLIASLIVIYSCSKDEAGTPANMVQKSASITSPALLSKIKSDPVCIDLRNIMKQSVDDAIADPHNVRGKDIGNIIAEAKKAKTAQGFNDVFIKNGIKNHEVFLRKQLRFLYVSSLLNQKYPQIKAMSRQDTKAIFNLDDYYGGNLETIKQRVSNVRSQLRKRDILLNTKK